uniref:Uncharacterized protein n=1 Tax=Heterorhabditis bacteriophora TaxID=37862 RepID=A0A1I7W7C4_HETBA
MAHYMISEPDSVYSLMHEKTRQSFGKLLLALFDSHWDTRGEYMCFKAKRDKGLMMATDYQLGCDQEIENASGMAFRKCKNRRLEKNGE